MRVFLAESDAQAARRIERALTREGHQVLLATMEEPGGAATLLASCDLLFTDGRSEEGVDGAGGSHGVPSDTLVPVVFLIPANNSPRPQPREGVRCLGYLMTGASDEELQKSLHALIDPVQPSGFSEMLEHHTAAMLVIEPSTGQIVEANEAARRFYGYESAAMRRMTIYDINQLPRSRVEIQMKAAQTQKRAVFLFSHRLASGEIRTVEVYSGPITMTRRSLLLSIIHDVTDRLKTERALEVSERKFSQAFHGTPDAVTLSRLADGVYVEVNQGFTDLLGYRLADVRGQSSLPGALGIWENSQDRERLLGLIDGYKDVIGFEATFRRKDGTIVIGLLSARVIDVEGTAHLLCIVRDITERKRMEEELTQQKERLAVTLGSIADGVIATDGDHRVILMNSAAEALTGWEGSGVIGRPVEEIFALFDAISGEPVANAAESALATGARAGPHPPVRLVAKGGATRSVEYSGSFIHDATGKMVGLVLVFRDVTLRESMGEKLQTAEKLESISILAGGIAHDFNNILTGILGNISLALLETPQSPALSELLGRAERATLRARDLTQQLLTFAKGGAPVKNLANVERLVREAATFSTHGSPCACRFQSAESLWLANVDEGQISQVIQNIVINAVQAMPSGGDVVVSLDNEKLSAENAYSLLPGPYVRIAIRDSGVGIPRGMLKRIFDPYFTTKQKGSGLGLATSYSIIKKHLGHIEASSEPGAGSLFTVFLPAVEDTHVASETSSARITVEGRGRRVLVMDDEPVVRTLVTRMLSVIGFQTAESGEGATAVELYRKAHEGGAPFALAILDLTIVGGVGGAETLRRILGIDPEARVIVSSGYANDPVLANHREHGFCAVLAKPYRLDDLKRVILDVLGT